MYFFMTTHFSFRELTCTNTGLPNIPNEFQKKMLNALAYKLEGVRLEFGFPLYINSAFRSRDVNRAVGGSRASYHCVGSAADINTRPFTYEQKIRLYDILRSSGAKEIIPYDTFVHVAYDFSAVDVPVPGQSSTFDEAYPDVMPHLK